ncbi:MAG: hypothetical protein DRJ39_02160 [Thermoprotei archaeon]|nr:MAG: hypothetical protein DRJ39_02160 [Thermoprotei archaeon]
MSLSIKRLVSKTKLPYPIFFAILCSSTYFFGVFLALLTDNLYNFFSEYGFILLCLFGYASGVFTIMLLNSLEASINEVRNYVVLKEEEWRSFRRKILEKATSRIYWLVFFFWIVYSFHHIFFTKMSWWKTSYNSQFIIDLYGFIVQGINGCFLGGIFMTLVSINLNLAYREIYSNNVFSTDIASSRGKRKLSKFKKLVVMETFAAAIVSALAVSIWSKQSFILLL